MTSFVECLACFGTGTVGIDPCRSCNGMGMVEEMDEWEEYEENGPMDLEDTLEWAISRPAVRR